MHSELEKIDVIRSRFDIGYDDANKALQEANGDVIGALALIEKEHIENPNILELAGEVANEVREYVEGGPIKKVKVKYGNKLLAEKPVMLTAAAALAVAVGAVLISKLVIEIERSEEEAVT